MYRIGFDLTTNSPGRALVRVLSVAAVVLSAPWIAGATAGAEPAPSQPASTVFGVGIALASDIRVTSGGVGSDAWYVFEPAHAPATAPVAIITHGYFEFAGFEMHRGLIEHTVRQGNIVVYPRYQTTPATACPGPFYIEPCIASEAAGINGALDYLAQHPERVQPDLDHTSYFGHSFGGIITTNVANRYRELGLPKPRVIFLDDPHDGGYAGVGEPAVDNTLAGIPSDVVFQCYVGASGVISGEGNQDSSCNAIFPKLGHIPEQNKDLILSYDDDHGSPTLSSQHGVSTGGGGDLPFLPPSTSVDAYDFKLWQLWDAARAYAYTGSDAELAVGDSPDRRSNGVWSDGVPVRELKIQKTAPIIP